MAADLPNEMECLELEDVASLLGVSERMVRNDINDNDLPCTGDGRGRRFVWSDVREWYVQYRIDLSGSRGSGRLGAETISTSETFDEAQLRKIKGEADLIELKLAAMRSHPEAEGRRTAPPVGGDQHGERSARKGLWRGEPETLTHDATGASSIVSLSGFDRITVWMSRLR